MRPQKVGLQILEPGARADDALAALDVALGDDTLGAPDDEGFLEATVMAESRDDAVGRVIDAVAASGADDHVIITEHREMPGQARRAAGDGQELNRPG